MSNSLFPLSPFDFNGIQAGGYYSPEQGYEKRQVVCKVPSDYSFSMEDLSEVHPLCSSDHFGHDSRNNMAAKGLHFFELDQQEQQQLRVPHSPKSNSLSLDDYFGSCFPAPAAQPTMQGKKKVENIFKPQKEIMSHPLSLSSSLDILNTYGSGIKKLNANQFDGGGSSCDDQKKLSTEEIMKVAGARYIQFSDQRYDDLSMLMHPFGYALSGLSEQETKDVELAHLLLAAAEKVGCQQFDRASKLLARCEWIAAERANPVQRAVYYFAEALRERIDKATGRVSLGGNSKPCETPHGLGTNMASLCVHQKIPFNQIMHIAQIQAITENIGSAKKLHLVDFAIRSGVQLTALMQALSERKVPRPLEHFKITAVGLSGIDNLEEIGKRLESFAKSINFPFTFRPVYVTSLSEVKEDMIKTSADESVVVICNMILRTMIRRPSCLENLMRVIKNLNPSLVVVGEVEANHNSPVFVNRFIEALFFYSAFFDCVETCMSQESEHKTTVEATFSNGIRSIVAMEGGERIARSVKIDVWRAFFARFRMIEIGFSESALYQASLVPKQYTFGSLCSFERNGKALIIGWKGTPLYSLSVWKFSRDRFGRSFPPYTF